MFDKIKQMLGISTINPKRTESKFRNCHVYFDDHELIVVCVYLTPCGLSPVGFPMRKFPREADCETVGKYVLKCLAESKLIEHEIDQLKILDNRVCSLSGFKEFYELAGVRNDRALSKKYHLIMVRQSIEDNVIALHTTRPESGGYVVTTNDPEFSSLPIACEIGEKVKKAMKYRPPLPKSRKKRPPSN